MTEVSDYLSLGIELCNRHSNLTEMFSEWPQDRMVILRVCRPHPEVEAMIDNWLKLHSEDQIVEGGVVENLFALHLDTSETEYRLINAQPDGTEPTAEIFITEDTFWNLAGRLDTLYTAFIRGRPIIIKSPKKMEIRDVVHMDKILMLIHESLSERGINIASLVR